MSRTLPPAPRQGPSGNAFVNVLCERHFPVLIQYRAKTRIVRVEFSAAAYREDGSYMLSSKQELSLEGEVHG